MAFKDNLRRLRLAAGLTQEQLALACGWSGQSRVANYESGAREPEFDELGKLGAALSVDWAELLSDMPAAAVKEQPWATVNGFAQATGLGTGAEANELRRDAQPEIQGHQPAQEAPTA
jgi:transcriptional regulator with XRE-family HTH domain